MSQKKNPTVEQMLEYRQLCNQIYTDNSHKAIQSFKEEYDVFTKVYEMNGRFGLKDACGEVLIPALFDDVLYTFADEYRNWVVPVLNDGKIAFVSPDGNGTLVSEFIYDSVNFLAGFYILISDDKQGIATINGQIVVPVEMDDLFEPFNDLLVFKKGDKFGFAMLNSALCTDAIYDSYEILDNEYLRVVRDNTIGYIDDKASFTTDEDKSFFNAMCN